MIIWAMRAKMNNTNRFRKFAGGLAAAAAIAGFAGSAGAGCPPFPDVPWWKNLSHEKVVNYVERKHGGEWDSYVAKWDRQLKKVEEVLKNGSVVVIKSKDVRLKGKHLETYVGMLKQRASVNRCLAAETKAAGAKPSLSIKATGAAS